MSSDGSRIAIGAPFNSGQSGHVRVFDWYGDARGWEQAGRDIDGEGYFGWSVAMSSDVSRIAVGSPAGKDDNGVRTGYIRTFDWYGGAQNWKRAGQDIVGEAGYNRFGTSVAISSDWSRIIGASYDNDNGRESGHVRIFDWDGGDAPNWKKVGQDIDGEAYGEGAGSSLAMSFNGTRIAVGATDGEDDTGLGHVRIYEVCGFMFLVDLREILNPTQHASFSHCYD
jgi:hypothetical protein